MYMSSHSCRPSRRISFATTSFLLLTLAACGGEASGSEGTGGSGNGVEVRLGYFPNLTHGTALVGLSEGLYEEALAEDGAALIAQDFNSGTDTIEALLGGGLDATYIGPSPTVAAYSQSNGEGVRVIAGATSGGAALVVQPEIGSVEDLRGEIVATPSVGNTQDIAARHYFETEGFETDTDGGGDVSILGQDNSVTVQAFKQGDIAGAWVPEPYVSILQESGGKILLDEAELWPGGDFVTTQLIVRTEFLEEHPDLVEDLLDAHVQSTTFINDNPEDAKAIIGEQLLELTQSELPAEVQTAAFDSLTFTNDPLATTLLESAEHAEEVEVIEPIEADLDALYELDALNEILAAAGEQEVSGP
ncbi:MAG: ABC-type probable sulfate transporter, periplasmic binding protein [uncultured Nocardioidaceae bacterium]|uniref:ABC-type probable sulfate transporter, periplasmic binding protein n=1 Tax=uncultured Nocardioidaceae bacterium TaxID=253824 RepID=A0A6J4MYB0_9ACTN|nr:MAG: ABC-type probable sulfate transporter, periplasmic binding protein [uncultured Nocardioidaceae bacterium]